MDRGTLTYDDSHAEEITVRCETVAGGVASLFLFVFKAREKVLDMGAGTGRDAATLLRLGVDVHAAEPSARLRQHALARHPELAGRIFDGALPDRLPAETAGPQGSAHSAGWRFQASPPILPAARERVNETAGAPSRSALPAGHPSGARRAPRSSPTSRRSLSTL